MKRSHTALSAVLVLLAVLGIGCTKKTAAEPESAEDAPTTPVQVAPAVRKNISAVLDLEAVVYPLRQATIVPKISAPIQRFLVQRGDHVRSGQLLATLEDRDLSAAADESKGLYEQAVATYQGTSAATLPDDLTRAKSDLQSATEGLDAATKVYESRVKLFKEGALAQKLVEDAKVAQVQAQSALDTARQHLQSLQTVGQASQLQAAQAQVSAAKAHYGSAEAQLSYSQIHSPLTGVVADRPLNVGEIAGAGSALLAIVDISRVVARANVPVDLASSIRVGQAGVIAAGEKELKGRITVVSPAVDQNTTTVQVWVEAANPGELIKLGSSVRIHVDVEDIKNAIVVPVAALLSAEGEGEKVIVAGTDSLAHDRPVQVGVRNQDEVQITKGLQPGERVVIAGGLGLDDKAKISVEGKTGDKPAANEKSGANDDK